MSYPQAMRPSGLLGRPFGWLMERINRPVYHGVLGALDPQPGASLLEIGFGTGGFLELFADTACPERIVGMDPSRLMLEKARSRMKKYKQVSSNLFLGDDQSLSDLNGCFDHVVSIHSFQFWTHPEQTLERILPLMQSGSKLCLALRQHKNPAPQWLPNPLSRRPDETDVTLRLLVDVGFAEAAIAERHSHTDILLAKYR